MDLKTLKQGAHSDQIYKVLVQLDTGLNEPVDLETSMVLIKFVLPVYPSLPERSKVILRRLASKSLTFLSQLVSFSTIISGRDGLKEISIYLDVLEDIVSLELGCLNSYLEASSNSKLYRDSVKALFFGSKLFNLLARRIDIAKYLEYLRLQWKFLFENNKTVKLNPPEFLGEWLVSTFLLNPTLATDIVLGELFLLEESYFSSFQKIVSASRPLDQRRLVAKFLLPYIQIGLTIENSNEVRKILGRFDLDKIVCLSVLFDIQSLLLKEIIVRLMSNHSSMKSVVALVSKFADFADNDVDTKTCELLVLFIVHNLSPSQKEQISHDDQFLNAVTKHLGSNEREARERAMFIAKLLSDGGLKYESDFEINIPNLKFESNSENKAINFQTLRNSSLPNIHLGVEKNKITEISSHVQSLTFDRGDSDDENDDDEEDLVKRIVFLKDLVKEYEQTGESRKAPLLPLLKQTVKLVRQKKDFPLEVGYYAQGILSSIACLNNEFDESLFEQWRINALVSVLVIIPNKVTHATKILFNSELSLQQRMSLLSALGLSARELRGFDDPTTVKPQFDFPTNRLPWDSQSHYSGKLVEVQELPSMIKETKTVWKSKKLSNDQEKGTQNRFRKHASIFFYPLAHGWLNGIDVGTYNQFFKSHYLKILRIIYSCANPVHDFEYMTELMDRIISLAVEEGIPLDHN